MLREAAAGAAAATAAVFFPSPRPADDSGAKGLHSLRQSADSPSANASEAVPTTAPGSSAPLSPPEARRLRASAAAATQARRASRGADGGRSGGEEEVEEEVEVEARRRPRQTAG